MYCVEELEEDEEAGCLLKFMKHAKSHTYHKHDLGYAFGGRGVGGGRYYIKLLKFSVAKLI